MTNVLFVYKVNPMGFGKKGPMIYGFNAINEGIKRQIPSYDADSDWTTVTNLLADPDARTKLRDVDLVIYGGGDSELLRLSAYVDETPILGVKILKESVGHFCASNLDTFESYLEQILAGEHPMHVYHRILASVDGEKTVPCLNDIFIGNVSPYKETQCNLVYRTGEGETKETQLRNFGLLISTAAGSSAWVQSAGGILLDPQSSQLQLISRRMGYPMPEGSSAYFVIQDPYPKDDTYPLFGNLEEGEEIELSDVRNGILHLFTKAETERHTMLPKHASFKVTYYGGEIHLSGEGLFPSEYVTDSYLFIAPQNPYDLTKLKISYRGKTAQLRSSGFLVALDRTRITNRNRDSPQDPLIIEPEQLLSISYNPRVYPGYLEKHGVLSIDGHFQRDLPRRDPPVQIEIKPYHSPLRVYK